MWSRKAVSRNSCAPKMYEWLALVFREGMALTEGGSFLVSSILSLLIFSGMQVAYRVQIVNTMGQSIKNTSVHIKEEASTSIKNLEVNVDCLGVQRHPSFLSAYDHCHWIHWIPAFCLPHYCRFFAFKAFKVDGITIVGNLSPVVTMCSWQLGEDRVWQQLPDQIGGGKIFIFCRCG